MARRIEIGIRENIKDVVGEKTRQRIESELGIKLDSVRFIDVYNINAELDQDELERIGNAVSDPVSQRYSTDGQMHVNFWRVEIGLLPGVTDNVGKTAKEAIMDCVGADVEVYHSRVYAFSGEMDEERLERISHLLHNPVIENISLLRPMSAVVPYIPNVIIRHEPKIEKISLRINEQKLESLAKQRMLALTSEEFKAIKQYLKKEEVVSERAKVGLDERITDVELECIAQTWSEHCKHKIFNAKISYNNGEKHAIDSLFKTFIRGATERVKKPYIVSVFKDNGGIIKFNHDWDLAVKVETHNAPSAIDPYGGALTGILGVQRDILGTGLGAMPIANTDVLCFGPLNAKEIPKGTMHPKKIQEGVTKGIEHGGNKMGIPIVNGSVIYEEGFVARPLVYCGTIGLLPSFINGRKTSEKNIEPGYLAVMAGGRIGKDGIHGATFSSQQIYEHAPQSIVQIGDPITQKKLMEFVLEARDKGLYEAITDNGAGGISSSIGELAGLSGGCEIYLEKCPLKYAGLDPWEILISESQERMTLAVHPSKMDELQKIGKKHDVEITAVGKFTNSGKLHATYNGEIAAYLDMELLHRGVPQMKLNAVWKKKNFTEPQLPADIDYGAKLLELLSLPNISSKENIIRQYDHEVKGTSVIKPVMLGPNDAGIIRPLLETEEGAVIAHGICSKFVQDGYDMAALAFDEAVRNAVAVGAKFGYLAALDNFSWPDPVQSDRTPDGETKLAELVRACISLYENTQAYGIPLISGKDSMKNDYYSGTLKYSIPPTLLVTMIGKIDNVNKAVSAEFKQTGDAIYIIGKTRDELGGSEFYKLFNAIGNYCPKVRPTEHVPVYRAISQAIEEGLISSAHDVSDGGIAVALAECAFPLGLGVDVDLGNAPAETELPAALLFSESAGRFVVSVQEKNTAAFEKIMHGKIFARIGRVRGDKRFIIRRGSDEILVNLEVWDLKNAWNNPKH
jgi:phosphoribosylformylglycinamidine synthase